jgi:spore coat protein CotH
MLRLILFLSMVLLTRITIAQGEHIYDDSLLHEIRVFSYNEPDWDSIVARYEREIYTPVRVMIDGIILDSVGIRIKGNNFYNNIDKGKFQAYKLDFNEFVKGQKYDGLKKINLNNREKMANHLGYKLCRDNGIIAPRTSFSKLYFDDELTGNYILIEQIDVTFLQQHFGNKDGNLYSASGKGAVLEYMGPDKEAYFYAYEKKTNEPENDYSDLIGMLRFFSLSTAGSFRDSVDHFFDFNPFLKAFVIEMTLCKRDAFYDAGRNFYLYHDPVPNKFIYIPDDFDYSFSDEFGFDLNFQNDVSPHLGDVSNIVMDKFFKSNELLAEYYSGVCAFLNESFNQDKLNSFIDQLLSFGEDNQFNYEDFSMRSVDEIRAFISKRKLSLVADLQSSGFTCISSVQGNQDLDPFNVRVYPNPFTSNIIVKTQNPYSRYELALIDVTGKTCFSASDLTGDHILQLENLADGMYLLNIRSSLMISRIKIVKNAL